MIGFHELKRRNQKSKKLKVEDMARERAQTGAEKRALSLGGELTLTGQKKKRENDRRARKLHKQGL